MVLQPAGSPAADSFNENAPSGDDDPYATSTPKVGALNYNIDVSKLPKPLPALSLLRDPNKFTNALNNRIKITTQLLQRPPNQEEVEAIAYWTAKLIAINAYSYPVGFLGGCWRAYNTGATFRFPFWQPNLETWNPRIFPHPRFVTLKGTTAIKMWHGMRWLLYGCVGSSIAEILFGSYALSVVTVGEATDKRLKSVTDAIRQRAQARRGGLQTPRMPGTTGSSRDGSISQSPPVDAASPTGGMFQEETSGLSKDSYNSSNAPPRQERPSPKPQRWPQRSQELPASVQEPRSQEDPFFVPDDAPPSGRADGSFATTSQQPQPQRQGSAWERLRQNPGKAPVERRTESAQTESGGWAGIREQGRSSTARSDSDFVGRDDNLDSAKAKAQEEFDAQVERERNGGDFGRGNGDQKRW